MTPFFSQIGKIHLLEIALGLVLFHLPIQAQENTQGSEIGSIFSNWKEKKADPLPSSKSPTLSQLKELEGKTDTYTINFTNISIVEYLRFASKVTNLNFVFHEEDLQFTVTIISEEAVTPSNLISILIQILRINGLVVLEQDNNLLITKVRNVSQFATVIDSDYDKVKISSPIVTRVFRIKNANLLTVSNVVKPMLSDTALLEVSQETQQLIVTDITTNIDKIAALLTSLDAPHSTLEIESYIVQNNTVDTLLRLTSEIMAPFISGAPYTLVPQYDSSTIFIIANPYLIEKTLTLLLNLDRPKTGAKSTTYSQTAFLYQPVHKFPYELMKILQKVADQLSKLGASQKLVDCLRSGEMIQDSNSVLFLTDEDTLAKLKEILPKLDTVNTEDPLLNERIEIFIYNIKHSTEEQIQNGLDALMEDLQKSTYSDPDLINTLGTGKYLADSNSLLFTGTKDSLKKLQEILPNFDTDTGSHGGAEFFVYYPKNQNGEELLKSIQNLSTDLKNGPLSDPQLLLALETVKWNPSAQSMVFTGRIEIIEKIKALMVTLDDASHSDEQNQTFFLYKLQHGKGNDVLENLKKIGSHFDDSKKVTNAFVKTLMNIEWVKENNSLLIKGPKSSVDQARTLIEQLDVKGDLSSHLTPKTSFFIYQPQHQKASDVAPSLKDLAKDLEASGLSDANLLSTINQARYVEATNSILFTGDVDTLEKIKPLLEKIDVLNPGEAQIEELGKTTFLLYKIQYVPGTQLITSVKGFVGDLAKTGATSPQTVQASENLKWIQPTNSILITGNPDSITEIEGVIKKFDLASLGPKSENVVPTTFVVYTPKYQTGETLISTLSEFYNHLSSAGVNNRNLGDTISNLKWMPQTSSLIISGDQESIEKILELLNRFDIATADSEKNSNPIESIQDNSFLIYKLQYHQGGEILNALKQIGSDLGGKTSTKNQNLLLAINSLQWIQVTNSLIASGDSETLTKLRTLVQNLDVPLRQVFIEVLVIETSVSNTQNFGLQWGGKMQYLNKFAAGMGNFPVPGENSTNNPISNSTTPPSIQAGVNSTNATTFPQASSIPFLNGFGMGVIGDIIKHNGKSFLSLGSLVNALQSDTESVIIMNPKLITQDNRTSTIFVGNNIPFIGSLVTTSANIVSSSSNIEYRDIGFNLTITPTIGNNDIIALEIINDITEVVGSPTIGSSNAANQQSTITGIQTSHTSMSTRVNVPNEHFVVLSGMITDTKTRFKTGIPCLGGLPLLGFLFSENDRVGAKQNVIIFLRPYIVDTYEQYKAITDHQQVLFKDSVPSQNLREDFDRGIDLIKTIENE